MFFGLVLLSSPLCYKGVILFPGEIKFANIACILGSCNSDSDLPSSDLYFEFHGFP